MPPYPLTPDGTRALANAASEAMRTLNHATLPADGHPGLKYPSDAYDLLGALYELAGRIPQLVEQISAFLLRQVQLDVVSIDGGEFVGDPIGAVGTASHELEGRATSAARDLSRAIDCARQAVAFASAVDPLRPDPDTGT